MSLLGMSQAGTGLDHSNEGCVALNAAALSHAMGKYEQCGVAYMKAYKLRYNCLSGFTSLLSEEVLEPTEAHMQFLREIKQDTRKPPEERAASAFSYGLMKYQYFSDRESAGRNYRLAIDVASAASSGECAKKVTMPNTQTRSYTLQPVGPMIGETLKVARENLSVITGERRTVSKDTELPVWAASIPTPLVRATVMSSDPIGDERVQAQHIVDECQKVSGESCDHCGAKRDDPNVNLKKCARCKLVCYCNMECAKAAWKASHKQACRAPGDFRAGDYARLEGLQSMPQLNNTIVHIVCRNEDTARWGVTLVGANTEDSLFAIKPENLRPVRQPKKLG